MTPARKRRQSPEAVIHRAVVDYLRAVLPQGSLVFHVPNETRRSGRSGDVERAINAGMGVTAGVPDLQIVTWSGNYWIEIKSKTGSLTPAQRAFHEDLRALGQRVAVVRSVDDARAALREWGVWTRETGVPQPDAPDGWRSIGEIARGMVRGAVE